MSKKMALLSHNTISISMSCLVAKYQTKRVVHRCRCRCRDALDLMSGFHRYEDQTPASNLVQHIKCGCYCCCTGASRSQNRLPKSRPSPPKVPSSPDFAQPTKCSCCAAVTVCCLVGCRHIYWRFSYETSRHSRSPWARPGLRVASVAGLLESIRRGYFLLPSSALFAHSCLMTTRE